MKKTSLFLLMGAALLLAFAPQVQAAVTQWDYSIESVFESSTFDGGYATFTSSTPTKLAWGDPAVGNDPDDRSSLVLDPASVSSTVNTYFGSGDITTFWADSVTVTHNNNPILAASQALTSTYIKNTITLTPLVPPGSELTPFIFSFYVAFVETPNASLYPNDVFALPDGIPTGGYSFDYGGVEYFINVFPTDTGAFTALGDYGTAYGFGADTLGFTTDGRGRNSGSFLIYYFKRPRTFNDTSPWLRTDRAGRDRPEEDRQVETNAAQSKTAGSICSLPFFYSHHIKRAELSFGPE